MSETPGPQKIIGQAKEFLASLTQRQRLLLFGGAALVALLLGTFVVVLSKPEMTTLYSNMEPADAQALGQQLAAKNFKYQISPDGRSVLVPSDQVQKARLEIADQGAPHSGRMGFEIFDKTNWASSDFDDKVNYQRALEGELERTIQSMTGVDAARVHLAIPQETIYTSEERPAKAAVILKTKEHRVSPQMRRAVQQLVASAVDRLDPQSVSVVDADAGGPESGGPLSASAEEKSAEEVLNDRLLHTLEPVVGSDHVRATVRIEYAPDTVEEQDETYDPTKTAVLTMQRSEEVNGGAGQVGGAAGTPSNVPGGGTAAKASANQMSSSSKSENGTYAVNRTVRHINEPAGRLKRLSVAVLVDDHYNPGNKYNPRQKRTPDEMKGLEDLAKAAVGFDATRGDQISVQDISFELLPQENPAPLSKLEKLRQFLTTWMQFVKLGLLVLLFAGIYFVAIRPVKKQLMRSLAPEPVKAALPAAEETAEALPEGETTPELPEAEEKEERPPVAQMKDEVVERVKRNPKVAARLVQSWLREDK